MQEYVLSVKVANKEGVLLRVSSLFSRRCFSIKSLNAAETEVPDVSRLTIVVAGDIKVLEQINAAHGTSFTLEIYTGEKDRRILSVFDGIPAIHINAFLTGADFEEIYRAANLHLHVESFCARETERVKFSVSTKIADCLGSGCCIYPAAP